MKSTALVFFLLISVFASAEDELPPLFSAEYSLHSMGTRIALMQRRFTKLENGNYLYYSETHTKGLLALIRKDSIIEQSTWLFEQAQFRPLHYSYAHTGDKKNRQVRIDFDWATSLISTSVNDSNWQMPMQPDIMDKLLYQLAIMVDLGKGKAPIKYTVADGGKIKNYDFDLLGEELINTPLGEFLTVKLERHKPNSKRMTTLWCARDLGYLPIKVENIETDGRKTTAIIESLSGIAY